MGGYALDGMELEDDAKTIPQVESPNKLEEKEKSEVTGEVTKALNEHFEAFNRLSKQHFAEGSDEESDSEDVEMEVDSPSKSEKPDADSIAAEDTSNLQLAWEMLELAKMIYERKAKDVSVEKKKEVLTALWDATSGLGEVAMEAGNFTQALAEFSSCLDARTSVLPKDSRSIAEAHFHMTCSSSSWSNDRIGGEHQGRHRRARGARPQPRQLGNWIYICPAQSAVLASD